MSIFDFAAAILTVAFSIVVVYAALRIARKCISTVDELRAGREILRQR
jgi:hypothetical protein